MAQQICLQCNKLFVHGDVVVAEIETRFVGLKSEVHYALERPNVCLSVRHKLCNYPQSGVPDEEE